MANKRKKGAHAKVGRKKRSPAAQLRALSVGQHITKRRHALGMSQTEVARQCGWEATRLWKYETGHDIPNGASCLKLSKVLGLSIHELISLANGSEDDESEEPAAAAAGAA